MPAPSNDFFAFAAPLSGASGSTSGTNAGSGHESGEPANNGYTVWWAWTAPKTGQYYFSTEGNDGTHWTAIPTVLQIFTGTIVTALTEVTYLQDERYGIGHGFEWPSRAAFNAVSGRIYYVRVDSRVQANVSGGALLQGNIFLKWNPFTPVQLGACGDCPVQFTSAIEQNCIGSGGVGDTTKNLAIPLVYLDANVPGVYQYTACGNTNPGGFAWFAWGKTFNIVDGAMGGGFKLYSLLSIDCDGSGNCSGFNGTSAVASESNPTGQIYSGGQLVIADNLYVSKQTILPCAPFDFGFIVAGSPWNLLPSPPSPLPDFYSGQTDYNNGDQVRACCCDSTSLGCSDSAYYYYQANQPIQGSAIPGGVFNLAGLDNAYWTGGEAAAPAQCSPFILYGGTFNSGQSGIIFWPGTAPKSYNPSYSGNVSYIPMMPNLVFGFYGIDRGTYIPFSCSPSCPPMTDVILNINKNLSNEFTWPNVTFTLLPGPNNLSSPAGQASPRGYTTGFYSEYLTQEAIYSVFAIGTETPAQTVSPTYSPTSFGWYFTTPAMPYVLDFEVKMNGFVAGIVSYTIQPVLQFTPNIFPLSGVEKCTLDIKNTGYGTSTNLKFSAACSNSSVKFTTSLGGGYTNQPSLTNVPLGQNVFGGDNNNLNNFLFTTNRIDGNTPVQFAFTFSDDTFSYPPLVVNVTL
ncbi:MAG TPA: hypothetical protein VGI03_14575 [Verrucomicrobiae bacterium]|jgi:hypothetical protein